MCTKDTMKLELIEIFSLEQIFDDTETLSAYASDKSFAPSMYPRFVIKPDNSKQVESLVQWANKTKTPLIPVSSTGSRYKGDTVPSVSDAIIVDLSNMNRILSINPKHRIAVVEPGVTYSQLQEELAKEGLAISVSLAPKTGKSVIANLLDVEPRLNSTHSWSYIDPLRCVEVTWGDGYQMFTGEASNGPQDLKKQQEADKWQAGPLGPISVDYYRMLTGSQGTMGIVTWASVKCELAPEIQKMYLVPTDKVENVTELAYRVLWHRFSDQLFIMNNAYLASLLGETPKDIMSRRSQLPLWTAAVGIAGWGLLPEERFRAQEADITSIARQAGLGMLENLPGANGELVMKKALHPCGEVYFKETLKGGFVDIFFITTMDKVPDFISEMNRLADELNYPKEDIGVYIQPQYMGTSCHCEFTLPYNVGDEKEITLVQNLKSKAESALSLKGAYYSRPYGEWWDLQKEKDPKIAEIQGRIKGIFDPNSIMNPGKIASRKEVNA